MEQWTEGTFRLQVGLDIGDQDGVVTPLFSKSTERLLAIGIDSLVGLCLGHSLHPRWNKHIVAVVDAFCLVSSSRKLGHPAAVRMTQYSALLRTIHAILICREKQREGMDGEESDINVSSVHRVKPHREMVIES